MLTMSKAVFLYGFPDVWEITSGYILNKLSELGNPDLFVYSYCKPLSITYKGKCIQKVVFAELPFDAIGQDFQVRDRWENKLKENLKADIEKSYDQVIDMCLSQIQDIMLTSFTQTRDGNIWNLDRERRRILFKEIFGNKVQELHYIDASDITTTDNDNLFFIPSVVNIAGHNKCRSVFSSSERIEQTLEQLNSIRNLRGKSILLEMSELNLQQINSLLKYADKIVLLYSDSDMNNLAHYNNNKNNAEMAALRKILPYFKDKPFARFFKFGGRYSATQSFNFNDFSLKYITGRVVKPEFHIYNTYVLEPVIYSVPKELIGEFISICDDILKYLESMNTDVETLLPLTITNKGLNIQNIDRLNVYGKGSTDGELRML